MCEVMYLFHYFFFPGVLSCSVLLKKNCFVSSYLTFCVCFYELGGVALAPASVCELCFRAAWQAGLHWSGRGLGISQGVPGASVLKKMLCFTESQLKGTL